MVAPDLSKLSKCELKAMFEAGLCVIDCHRVLAKTQDSLVGVLLEPYEAFVEWDHYPENDIFDPETFSQAYYHSHEVDDRGPEHGHFHLFLDEEARPKTMEPLFIPKPDEEGDIETLTHLVGISMDYKSLPKQLFTVNHWVTDEIVYKAKDMIPLIDRFDLDIQHPNWHVNIWLTNMVRLYRPHIEALLIERDRVREAFLTGLSEPLKNDPDYSVFEDENIEILSHLSIDIDAHMAELQELIT